MTRLEACLGLTTQTLERMRDEPLYVRQCLEYHDRVYGESWIERWYRLTGTRPQVLGDGWARRSKCTDNGNGNLRHHDA